MIKNKEIYFNGGMLTLRQESTFLNDKKEEVPVSKALVISQKGKNLALSGVSVRGLMAKLSDQTDPDYAILNDFLDSF